MTRCTHRRPTPMPFIGMLLTLLCDGLCFLFLGLRSRSALAAEIGFPRTQLALYQGLGGLHHENRLGQKAA
jgi:hypothetical protein